MASPATRKKRTPFTHPAGLVHVQALDFWLARLAVAAIAALQLLLINDFSIGPRWLGPTIELALLLPLAVATAWHQGRVRRASTDAHWAAIVRHRVALRRAAIMLTAVVSCLNFGSLILLLRTLLRGHVAVGSTLLLDAINVWSINVIVFALWFWALDRGGPSSRSATGEGAPEFLFPQLTMPRKDDEPAFSPGFVDYLFLAFTNATAFSPTDTAPLSRRAKLLFMAEASVSLLTVALVAARAVNILA